MQDTVKITLEIMAEKMLSQYIIRNEEIEEQMKVGIINAFENFNFETEIEKMVSKTINDTIHSSTGWRKVKDLVQAKADKIVDDFIEKETQKLKERLSNEL